LYFQDLDYNSKIFSFEFKSRINDKLKFWNIGGLRLIHDQEHTIKLIMTGLTF
jgi:hypothetical protein